MGILDGTDTPKGVPQRYIFKKCINQHCTTMIGWTVGAKQGLTECKWCQEGRAYWQQESQDMADNAPEMEYEKASHETQ